ncbi:hypothetical protein ACIBF1_19275 [Spirillospora sp. NPDC050679]
MAYLNRMVRRVPPCEKHRGGVPLDTDSSRLAALAATRNLFLTPGFHFSPDGALAVTCGFLPPEALDATADRLTDAHAALEDVR